MWMCAEKDHLLYQQISVITGCKVESISLNVDAVNTHREKPEVGYATLAFVASVVERNGCVVCLQGANTLDVFKANGKHLATF